jgi:hypothetical protein
MTLGVLSKYQRYGIGTAGAARRSAASSAAIVSANSVRVRVCVQVRSC